MVAGAEGKRAPDQGLDEANEAAAIHYDCVVDLVPECPIEMAGRDAEITADIDDDRADRTAAHLGGDFLLGGEVRETRDFAAVGALGFGLGIGRLNLPCGARPWRGGRADGRRAQVRPARGTPAQSDFQGRGEAQAIGDASEDGSDIGGAEGSGELGEARDGGTLLNRDGELLAVVDQFADEAEDAADAGGYVRAGPVWIGIRGRGGGLRAGVHERNKNAKERFCQAKSLTD